MSKYERNKICYIVICIEEFSNKKQISRKDAYNYLKEYKGLEFLDEYYDAEHTLSLDDTVDDLTTKCQNNRGKIL